jgi:glycosyltransferase involved in cell wall biosynthesis
VPERLRIGLIASATQTVEQPFAGGMEAHTAALAASLRARGHEVTIHSGSGARPAAGVAPVGAPLRLSAAARGDVSMPAPRFMEEHHAYLELMLEIDELGYDVIHNNCLHYLPVAMAPAVRTPMLTTLHSPPTPWLESAIRCAGDGGTRWVSVSATNARAWAHACEPCAVIHNGIDLGAWAYRPRPRARTAVWSGRIVPEKGTHLAIEAASLAGIPLSVAGPIGDEAYFRRCMDVAGADVVYRGHLDSTALAALVGEAAVSLVTPSWEEPFGLVAIEALACGTPVAAFSRGALPELIDERCGALAAADDPADLAAKIGTALRRSRRACRRRAEEGFSLGRMTDRYVDAYRELA